MQTVERTAAGASGDAPAEVLMSVAAEAGAVLIVVGNRGIGGFRALLMGGTCRALIDHAPCPVATVPKTADTAAK
jgi:nucleotide-binding universal stress UspA family protein